MIESNMGAVMDVSPSPVPWSQLAGFIRQFGHDIRNDLNALSLEAALLKELVADPEAVTSANRIQTQLREIANRLKDLSTRYALPAAQPAPISLADLEVQLLSTPENKALEWQECASAKMVVTDPVLLGRAFRELAVNAMRHTGLRDRPRVHLAENPDGGGVLTLMEPGVEPYAWPETPFATPRAGRYGAGLYLAASIFRSLGAKVTQEARDGGVETRIALPKA